ncbi:MAG TPA: Na+/H+ antiporter subunit E, partial [Burkholderiaceae bacterium]
MNKLLPSPWLSLALLVLWLLLNGLDAGHLLLGAVLAVLVPLGTQSLRPTPMRLRHPLVALRLLLRVGRDAIASNLDIARTVLGAGRRQPRSAFVVVPLDLRDPVALAALSSIMCVIPGTVWCEIALDRSALLLHVFDLRDEAALVNDI